MATTPNLGLTKPTVGGDLDQWGTYLDTNLDLIDQNCFSQSNPVPSSAININGDLVFNNSYNLTSVRSLRVSNQSSQLSSGADTLCLYAYGNDLYWNTVAGSPVRLTAGTAINAAGITVNVFVNQAVSANLTIAGSDSYDLLLVNTAAARTITLPLASSVSSGRRYYIKDITGSAQTNNITLTRSGTNSIEGVAGNHPLTTNWGSWLVVSDGSSNWYLL